MSGGHVVVTITFESNMDASRCTGRLYVDLRKAFDTVHHGNLLSKLLHYGIKNLELAWLEDYLFNRTEYVCYDGVRSQTEHITYGVPLGINTWPTLVRNLDQ